MTTPSFSNTRKTSFDVNKLKQKIQKSEKKYDKKDSGDDNRFWKLTVDKSQAGEATLRFLPGVIETDNDLPYVEVFTHVFKGAGGTFWETCRNTIGEPCPICAANSELYKTMDKEQAKKIAGPRKKQQQYIANVLVLDDKGAPENNGKVFLFKFGPVIFKKLIDQMDGDPENPNFIQVIPFTLDETGADFKLVSHEEDNYRKYSKSFYKKNTVSSVSDAVLSQQVSLKEFVDTTKVKSSEELMKRFDKVLKKTSTASETVEGTLESAEPPQLSAAEEETLESLNTNTLDSNTDVDAEIAALLASD